MGVADLFWDSRSPYEKAWDGDWSWEFALEFGKSLGHMTENERIGKEEYITFKVSQIRSRLDQILRLSRNADQEYYERGYDTPPTKPMKPYEIRYEKLEHEVEKLRESISDGELDLINTVGNE